MPEDRAELRLQVGPNIHPREAAWALHGAARFLREGGGNETSYVRALHYIQRRPTLPSRERLRTALHGLRQLQRLIEQYVYRRWLELVYSVACERQPTLPRSAQSFYDHVLVLIFVGHAGSGTSSGGTGKPAARLLGIPAQWAMLAKKEGKAPWPVRRVYDSLSYRKPTARPGDPLTWCSYEFARTLTQPTRPRASGALRGLLHQAAPDPALCNRLLKWLREGLAARQRLTDDDLESTPSSHWPLQHHHRLTELVKQIVACIDDETPLQLDLQQRQTLIWAVGCQAIPERELWSAGFQQGWANAPQLIRKYVRDLCLREALLGALLDVEAPERFSDQGWPPNFPPDLGAKEPEDIHSDEETRQAQSDDKVVELRFSDDAGGLEPLADDDDLPEEVLFGSDDEAPAPGQPRGLDTTHGTDAREVPPSSFEGGDPLGLPPVPPPVSPPPVSSPPTSVPEEGDPPAPSPDAASFKNTLQFLHLLRDHEEMKTHFEALDTWLSHVERAVDREHAKQSVYARHWHFTWDEFPNDWQWYLDGAKKFWTKAAQVQLGSSVLGARRLQGQVECRELSQWPQFGFPSVVRWTPGRAPPPEEPARSRTEAVEVAALFQLLERRGGYGSVLAHCLAHPIYALPRLREAYRAGPGDPPKAEVQDLLSEAQAWHAVLRASSPSPRGAVLFYRAAAEAPNPGDVLESYWYLLGLGVAHTCGCAACVAGGAERLILEATAKPLQRPYRAGHVMERWRAHLEQILLDPSWPASIGMLVQPTRLSVPKPLAHLREHHAFHQVGRDASGVQAWYIPGTPRLEDVVAVAQRPRTNAGPLGILLERDPNLSDEALETAGLALTHICGDVPCLLLLDT